MDAATKNRIRELTPYFVVVLLIIIPWFFTSGYLFFIDFVLGPKVILDWQNNLFLLNLFIKFLSFLFPVDWLEKIFLSSIICIVLLAGRFLVKQILLFYHGDIVKDKSCNILVFGLALFSLFNPFIYDRVMYGQWGIVLSIGFFLASVGYLLKILNFKKEILLIYVWFYAGLAILFSHHFIFLLIPFLVLFYILFWRNQLKIKKVLQYSVLGWLVLILLNINWLIPLFIYNNTNYNIALINNINESDYQAFKTAGNNPLGIFQNIIMMSGFWGKDYGRYFDLTKFRDIWGRSFLFLAPLIIYGMYISLQNKKTRFLSISLLIIEGVAVFLAVGVGAPASRGFSLFLYDVLPFYKGLRETQKWVAVEIIVYLFFLSQGVYHLFNLKKIQPHRFTVIAFLIGVIIMQAPLLLWGFSGQVKSTNYPHDWYEADKKIVEDGNCQKKILFFPWHLYISFDWVGGVIANPAPVFFNCSVVSGSNMEWGGIYDNIFQDSNNIINKWVLFDGSPEVLLKITKNLNIGYIILAKEVDYQVYQNKINILLHNNKLDIILDTPTLLVYKIISL